MDETIKRLTNPPINVTPTLLPAISMIIMQFRNRRTGLRRTFQIAEIQEDSKPNVLMQYNAKRDILQDKGKSRSLFNTLQLFTGNSRNEINKDIKEKEKILKWMVKQQIKTIDGVGRVMAEYYTNQRDLMKYVNKGSKMPL